MPTSFVIAAPPQFDFERAVFSHGWYMLAPFEWNDASATLGTVWQSPTRDVLRLRLSADEGGVRVATLDRDQLTPNLREAVDGVVRKMLNLDWDLGDFYAAMRAYSGYEWLESERRGRILVSASLWEDLVKVLLTTNCNWAQTVAMAGRVCRLGPAHADYPDCHAFPTPQQIASLDFDALADAVRAGYRSAYLYDLARTVAAGSIDLDAWQQLDSDNLFLAVKSLRGFGDYAAGTITRMYGHFDKIAIDSACREMYANLHNGGVRGGDGDIKAHYARYGKWRGLVMWMDIMRRNAE